MGEKLEALLGEIKDDLEQRKQWASRRELTRKREADMECHTCHKKGHFVRASARPPSKPKDVWEMDSRRCHSRRGARTGPEQVDRRNMGGGKRFIPEGTDSW